MSDIPVALRTDGEALALTAAETTPSSGIESLATLTEPLVAKVESILADAPAPLTVAAIRAVCRVRTQTLTRTLAALVESGRLLHTPAGYRLP